MKSENQSNQSNQLNTKPYHLLLSLINILGWQFIINNVTTFTNTLSFAQVIDVLKTLQWLILRL